MRTFFLLMLLSMGMEAQADWSWWSQHTATNSLMLASNIAIMADWAQTREIADNTNFYEKNSMLGRRPTSGEVNRFFAGTVIFHNLIGSLLPEKYRDVYYSSQLSFRLGVVKDNADIGIEFKF